MSLPPGLVAPCARAMVGRALCALGVTGGAAAHFLAHAPLPGIGEVHFAICLGCRDPWRRAA